MVRMSETTCATLAAALADSATVDRYWSHVRRDADTGCWWWTGAISGRGHGRFYLGSVRGRTGRRHTVVVIAHRFGYALTHGIDAMLRVEEFAHRCDNPLCQRPADEHFHPSTSSANRREYYARRDMVLGPLSDVRGARRRAWELREAARNGDDLRQALDAGALPMHRNQIPMFDLEHDER